MVMNNKLPTMQMMCRDCGATMDLIDHSGKIEAFKCPECERNTIRAFGEEVIHHLPEVNEWKGLNK